MIASERVAKYDSVIRAIARKNAAPFGCADDEDLMDDLTQVGRMAVLSVSKQQAHTNFDALTRTAIRNQQIDFLRRWFRMSPTTPNHRFVSLDVAMEHGYDITLNEDTGERELRRFVNGDYRHGGIAWAAGSPNVWGL